LSKPIKRQPGERSIPNWQIGVGSEKFTDVKYQVAEGIAKITINDPR
jgi:Dihydroxynaphthoic acid synthase